jgi:hypothetical protein
MLIVAFAVFVAVLGGLAYLVFSAAQREHRERNTRREGL